MDTLGEILVFILSLIILAVGGAIVVGIVGAVLFTTFTYAPAWLFYFTCFVICAVVGAVWFG